MKPDREKVMRGLECCITGDPDGSRECKKCPYRRKGITNEPCFNALHADTLALLKEQEARVMKREEVDESRGVNVWAEIYSPHFRRLVLIYCAVRRSETIPEFYNLIEDSGVCWSRTDRDYNANKFFGIFSGWRCWTARPTEEQRDNTPWESTKEDADENADL